MPNSLIELREEISQLVPRNPRPEPEPQETAPSVPGDVAMQRALSLAQEKTKEDAFARRAFQESEALVQERIKNDADYAQFILPELETLSGEKYVEKIMEEGDKERAYQRAQMDPEGLSSWKAARTAYFNSASFGQLTKLKGAYSEAQDPGSYDEAVYQAATEARILKRMFPKADIAGEIASYITPFTGPGAIFRGATKVVAGLAGKTLSQSVLKSLAARTATAATEAGLGVGVSEGIAGTLGRDFQGFSIERGIEEGVSKGIPAAGFGAATPVLGAALRGTFGAAGRLAKATVGSLDNAIEAVTGTPASALRAYNKNAEKVKAAYGTEAQVGQDVVSFLQSKKLNLPERQAADHALRAMGEVDASTFFQYLDELEGKLASQSETIGAAANLKTLVQDFKTKLPGAPDPSGLVFQPSAKAIRPELVREYVDRMQKIIDDGFGKETPAYLTSLKKAQFKGNQTLRDFAQTQGEAGQAYLENMALTAKKRRILDLVTKDVGKTAEVQEKRAQAYIDNLFGRNKAVQEMRLKKLDETFGTNFHERAQTAQYAQSLGPGGVPQVLPAQPTGRSMLGIAVGSGVGGVVGGIPGALVGAAATSPKAGAVILGVADRISGFAERVVANPTALKTVAASPKADPIVKRVAKEVLSTLKNDGPVSAASALRIVADTPYFVGLVHAFEIADRSRDKSGQYAGVAQEAEKEITIRPR